MSSGRVKAICNNVHRPAPRQAACANVELRVPTQVPAEFLPLLLHINEFLPLMQHFQLPVDHRLISNAEGAYTILDTAHLKSLSFRDL